MGMWIKTSEVAGLESAIHGMRNPMNSWDKSDTVVEFYEILDMTWNLDELTDLHEQEISGKTIIGKNDLDLAQKLIKAGSEHSKFLRQIQVWANFNMPRYWWSEFDTYKFNTKNSCSTMHTIMKKPLSMDDFYLGENPPEYIKQMIFGMGIELEDYREKYLETKDYKYVIQMKRLLPESFIQLRTVNTNYAELRSIYFQRRTHRLKEEWVDTFCAWIATLPYAKELIMLEDK